jgi:hypothetical protein
MRIGGAFTFGQVSVPIGLAGGEVFYLPPGNYMYSLGSQSCLQWFDPINTIWRNVAWPGSMGNVISPDGFNFRIINLSGVVSGCLITNVGSGGTNGIGAAATGATVTFGSAPTNGVLAQAYPIVGGKLNTLNIAAAGSGYVMPPMLLIDPPPIGGIQATATCTISGGAINAVTLQNAGAGYVTTPNVYIVPQWLTAQAAGAPINVPAITSVVPPGTPSFLPPPMLPAINWGAQLLSPASAASIVCSGITGSGTLTGIGMIDYGLGYAGTTIPTVTVTGVGAAAATAIMSFAVISLGTAGSGGVAYTVGTPWESSYGLVAANDGCNGIYQPRAARGLIQSTTGFTGTAASIEDAGFGLQKVPNIGTTQFGSIITTISTTTAVVGGVYDVSVLQPAVED